MRRIALPIFAAGLLLSSCVFGPRGEPKYFVLNPGEPPSMKAMRTSETVSVNFVDIGAPYSSAGFVYRLNDDRWEVDPYNQFLVSPAEMMTSVLRNWIQESQLYGNVAIPGEGGGQTFIIDCDVMELYGDFQDPSSPKAVMKFEIQVFKRQPNGRDLVLRKTFSQSIPFSQRTPQALVDAWNEGLRISLDQLLGALAGTVR